MVNFKTTQKGIENGNMRYSNQQQKIKKIEDNNALKQVRIEKQVMLGREQQQNNLTTDV